MHRIRILALLFLPLIGLSVFGVLLAQEGGGGPDAPVRHDLRDECREVLLTRKPGWALSGAWTSADQPQLLIVDPVYATILRYSATGESIGPIGEPLKSTLENLLPVVGKSSESDLIVETSDGLMVLDKNLRPSVNRTIISKGSGQWRIDGLWQWEPVGKGHKDIVAFTDIVARDSDENDLRNWKSAFVRFPLENPNALTVLHEVSLTGDDKTFFRSDYPFIASLGDTAYMLSTNNGLTLYKSEKGSAELKDISELLPDSIGVPRMPPFNARQDYYAPLMEELEKQAMPAGLFGWNDALYILSREPEGRGTRWMLISLDPRRKKPTGTIELPIRANHVTVVPGNKVWAFIEKGPVKSYGVQESSRMLLITSRLLEAPLRSTGMLCSSN